MILDQELVDLHPTASIAETAVIGGRYRRLLEGTWKDRGEITSIGESVEIGHYCIVGQGARVGARAVLEDYVRVAGGATIGEDVLLVDRADVGVGARIGNSSVVGGFLAERSVVGRDCRVFGKLLHRTLDPSLPWDSDAAREDSPVVGDGAFIGRDAMLLGPVQIGNRAYVTAGAIVLGDVPDRNVAYGHNKVVPAADWPGTLSRSNFFRAPLAGGHASP